MTGVQTCALPIFSLFTFHFDAGTHTSVKTSIAPSLFIRHLLVKRQPDSSSPHCKHPFSFLICPKHIATDTKQHPQITTSSQQQLLETSTLQLSIRNRHLPCSSFTSFNPTLTSTFTNNWLLRNIRSMCSETFGQCAMQFTTHIPIPHTAMHVSSVCLCVLLHMCSLIGVRAIVVLVG